MKIQPRYKELLSHLNRYGVLSTRQIRDVFFKKISHTTVMRRLRKLEEKNFVGRVLGLEDGVFAWRLGAKGAALIGADASFRYSNRNAIDHEVTLSQVRMSLESVGLGKDWVTEMEMKRRHYIQNRRSENTEHVVPDGIFTSVNRDNPVVVAVELELHVKASSRYEKLFGQYLRKDSIFLIWYIVPSHEVGRKILQEWEAGRI